MTVSLMETDKKNYRKVKKHIICNFSSVLIKFLFLAQVRSALKLLDLLEELESVFDEGPLLLCDVKPEHFGVSEHGRVKVLDSDTVAFKDVLGGPESCSCRSCRVCPAKMALDIGGRGVGSWEGGQPNFGFLRGKWGRIKDKK